MNIKRLIIKILGIDKLSMIADQLDTCTAKLINLENKIIKIENKHEASLQILSSIEHDLHIITDNINLSREEYTKKSAYSVSWELMNLPCTDKKKFF